ncbi:Uma2 family endonuclease [Runella salmonicolor]|uniref:Uma2 family endonuclease n=1 Tax=Runella salmonicolor TaxID=2950278 RepID=A0ABT1FU38_9BACT|nr:Uma2 family endonuclease [Runella salmonicolor]MCP1385290.1 Uma2 family endonuclease [Runella salmonicolor]
MGLPAHNHQFYTIAEYLELERQTGIKYEYEDGEVFAMAGGTVEHSLIGNNIGGELRRVLKNRPCNAYNSDLKIAISEEKYRYADASVICGPVEYFDENPEAAKNPVLIVEVLSESSESYDRGEKFKKYRQIPTFREYVLIEQRFPLVEVFFKIDEKTWQYRVYEQLDQMVQLDSIEAEIPLAELYSGVIFNEQTSN